MLLALAFVHEVHLALQDTTHTELCAFVLDVVCESLEC